MVRLAMTTNTAMATTASVVVSPETWASPAAAPAVKIRFFGFTAASATPSPRALTGDTDSTDASHFGMTGSVPGAGRFRQLRRARASMPTPNAMVPHDTDSDAVLLVWGTLPSGDTTQMRV